MSSARFWQVTGLAAAGGVGYYLYQSGGSAKGAEKRAEADAAKLSREVKGHLPGAGKEAQKQGEVFAADAGRKLDDVVASAKDGVSNIDRKLEQYRREAEKNIDGKMKEAQDKANSAIDQFDKRVTDGARQAKSGVSSWFGGSK
ncbi:hypothetical protein K470DRAFT_299297 [Piedraia hortae CBS 480.64]|uniref:Calcofluor white hypersensitive protein n=1 Tax=Piedraia hortae CBS 480.64 TaxID=1314780 RepID=A0A6A7C1H9_9PEZI|nr:hypothetical protein K470DRAFT_299297 [Piedraia hortae CBS 480.64]